MAIQRSNKVASLLVLVSTIILAIIVDENITVGYIKQGKYDLHLWTVLVVVIGLVVAVKILVRGMLNGAGGKQVDGSHGASTETSIHTAHAELGEMPRVVSKAESVGPPSHPTQGETPVMPRREHSPLIQEIRKQSDSDEYLETM